MQIPLGGVTLLNVISLFQSTQKAGAGQTSAGPRARPAGYRAVGADVGARGEGAKAQETAASPNP